MTVLSNVAVSQKGDQDDKDKRSSMGDAEDDKRPVPPSELTSELAWRLVDKVSRLDQSESQAMEVYQMSQLGDYVKVSRRRLGLSRSELADQIALPLSLIVALENGLVTREEITVNQLNQLTCKLDVSIDALEAFLSEEDLVERTVSSVKNDNSKGRTMMDKMMQMMERIANMSRMQRIMVMMGTLIVAMIAMVMLAREMLPSGM